MNINTRLLTSDLILTSNILGLNDGQRYLVLVLPAIADTNGCFESDPRKICQLTYSKITDLEQLFRILQNEGLIESYEVQGKQYWYLPQFLDSQRLRTKAQIPSPPWLYWKPERGAENQGHTSQGRYFDNRKQPLQLTTSEPIDKKFTLDVEEKRRDIDKEDKGVNILSNKDSRILTDNDKDEIIAKLFDEIVDEVEKLALDYGTQKSYIAMGMTHKTRQAGVNDRLELYKYTKKDVWELELK